MGRGPDSQQGYSESEDYNSGFFPASDKEELSARLIKIPSAEMEDGKVLTIYTGKGAEIGKLKLNGPNGRIRTYSLLLPDTSEVLLHIPKKVSDETVSVRFTVGLEHFPKLVFGEAGEQMEKQQLEIIIDSNADVALRDCGTNVGTVIKRPEEEKIEIYPDIEQVPCGQDGTIEGVVEGRRFFGGTSREIGVITSEKDVPGAVGEDNIGVNKRDKIFALADGVASGISGEVAAHRAVQSLIRNGKTGISRAVYMAGYNHWYLNAFLSDYGAERGLSDTCYVACKIDDGKMEASGVGDSRIVVVGHVNGKPKIIYSSLRDSESWGEYDLEKKRSGEKAEITERDVYTDPVFITKSRRIQRSLSTESLTIFEGRLPDIDTIDLPDDAYVVMTSDGMELLEHEIISCVDGQSPEDAYRNIYELVKKKNSSTHENEFGVEVPMYLQDFDDGGKDEYIDPPIDNGSCIVIGPKKV